MSVRLDESVIKFLHASKNLLAFSGGVDSSALFFLLLKKGVPFDVACVNYQTRQNSNTEALHVKSLAKEHKKEAYILTCKLKESNFEHEARKARYSFFDEIIKKHGYKNLILAHQLDDRFEWFMMQMCKGAGVSELAGFDMVEKRDGYDIIRPLWQHTKKDIKAYLDKNSLPYFEDESNFDTKYKRNFFRQNITSKLLDEYEIGIKNSLGYILKDAKVLNGEFCFQKKELFVYELQSDEINIRLIDKAIKRLGYIMSQDSRVEALKPNAVINRKIAVGKNETYGFIAPYIDEKMDKKFKEKCRIAKIPLHVRAYMFKEGIDVENLR